MGRRRVPLIQASAQRGYFFTALAPFPKTGWISAEKPERTKGGKVFSRGWTGTCLNFPENRIQGVVTDMRSQKHGETTGLASPENPLHFGNQAS